MKQSDTGIVFNIQRFSLHDGPGIRTTVFLKGCNLRCAWCHNPESLKKEPQISVLVQQCSFCKACMEVCPRDVHTITDDNRHLIKQESCILCGRCVSACPAGIIRVIGKEYTANEVMGTVLRDYTYYASGGGVTFSGGEPTCQPGFLLSLLILAKRNGLHVCLDTNGQYNSEMLRQFNPYVDMYLLDYKISDPKAYNNYVGSGVCRVHETLKTIKKLEGSVHLRCPVIPGINDNDAHFEAIRGLRRDYPIIKEIEVMPYHKTGSSKWENIGLEYSLGNVQPPIQETIDDWNKKIRLHKQKRSEFRD